MTSTAVPPTAPNPQAAGGLPGQQQPVPQTAPQPTQQQVPGLPPTGLQQQLASLNNYYGQVQSAQTQLGSIGFNVAAMQNQQAQATGQQALSNQSIGGSTSLNNMAQQLAQRYGLPIGRGRLVDENGNILLTPDQIANASGGSVTLGEAAAKLNYISQAIANKQNQDQQQKGIAAMQTGLGLVQDRGRGSMAAMQSGMYEGLADLYANQEYEAADFSYFIQQEQNQIQAELERRARKQQKKAARMGTFTGLALGAAGALTGNFALAASGFTSAAGNASNTGWF